MSQAVVNCCAKTLNVGGVSFRCAIGKAGYTKNKREGDNKTPLGEFDLRKIWVRFDKVNLPAIKLSSREIKANDGWCDAPDHPQYNRYVTLPFAPSHEKLWRDDDVYDIIVELGYNDDPVQAYKGSAVFFHIARPDYSGTEGCVAVKLEDMLQILPMLDESSKFIITAERQA